MPYSANHSTHSDTSAALQSVCDSVAAGLGGGPADLAFLFVSHHHADYFDRLAGEVRGRIRARVLLGCAAETVAGGGEEIENEPAVSLWAAVLPGAKIETFHATFAQTPDGIVCAGLPASGQQSADISATFALGEPYSTEPNVLIARLAEELPNAPLLGGMASGGGPGENRLFMGDNEVQEGVVGAVVRGGPRIRSIVSQGCRPIGTPFVVTRAEQNVIFGLGGASPLSRLHELYPQLSPQDQRLLRGGLHVGIVMNEYQPSFQRGDFLISNVIGAREEDGSLAIGSRIRVGQTVQFHVRDAVTADEELVHLLGRDRAAHSSSGPKAALLFSCNGRGTRLFREPHHDAATIQREAGPIPLAGFFAQGELGPVGGKNYIHGFTASVALFE
jgi:small ligand-binding sensory domain FIST